MRRSEISLAISLVIKRGFMADTQSLNIKDFGKEFDWKEEEFEETNGVYVKTNYPEPHKKFRLVYESFTLSMEETYFWILNQLRYSLSFPKVEKITDIFSSAENSSMFGQTAQRLSIQQDKVQTLLASVGKMIKDLFALVREMRIIDERLVAYRAWYNEETKKTSKSADITLKEIFINFVENQGGQMKTSSVYGLAQNLGYTTLPDYFFNTQVYDKEKIDGIVDGLPTNMNIKNVLRRKLFEFIIWKEQTEKELNSRRSFNLQYLRQHWAVIKMYMGWLKPYLRNVKRLSMNEQQIMSPDIVSAFETATLEVEILAYNPEASPSGCILVTFKYFVKPSLSYQQPESYQRGPIHVGRVDMSFRSYGWTKEEIAHYKKYREREELELLSVIDGSIKAAMDALSTDLEKYLAEAGEEEFKKKAEKEKEEKEDKRTPIQKFFNIEVVDKKEKSNSVFEPFISVFMGFGELIGAVAVPFSMQAANPKGPDKDKAKEVAKKASSDMWLLLKNYKKSQRLLTW